MIGKRDVAKVLFCESSADGTIGGSHYCLLYLIEHLDRTRFEPLVVFYEPNPILPRFEAAAKTIIHPQDRPVQWSNAGALPALAGRAVNFFRFLAVVRSHIAFLRRHHIDIVHLNNSITRHQDWALAAFLAKVPCIVHERGLNRAYTARDRALARRLALIIPMSAWIRDHMVERGVPGENIRVMYDGLDPDLVKVTTPAAELRQAWNIGDHERVIGIVGNVREWKGQETVVRAMIEVARRFPNVVCFIVGNTTTADQAYLAKLKKIAADAGIERNLRFTGFQRDVPSFMNMMEVVIHASIAPEPFGMVVLEGMAQRKAVIGSRAGGVIEMVVEGETGFTFPPGDAQTLAARIGNLLEDPARAVRMGEAGYERLLREFTITKYMNNIHGTYEAVLDRRPVPADLGLPATAASALRSQV
jgi:glycosyltransferase involved in cell wall biosynthesis